MQKLNENKKLREQIRSSRDNLPNSQHCESNITNNNSINNNSRSSNSSSNNNNNNSNGNGNKSTSNNNNTYVIDSDNDSPLPTNNDNIVFLVYSSSHDSNPLKFRCLKVSPFSLFLFVNFSFTVKV